MPLHLLLSTLALALAFALALASSSSDDVKSLLEFKKGIKSDPLQKIFDSWSSSAVDSSGCPHGWAGVVCGGDGFVTSVALDGLGLIGDLKFNTLIGLKMLSNLSLSGNSFTGRLVPAMGSLSTLQYLDLSGNMFYGPVPERINDLWGLHYLNLSSNNFSGGFPSGIRNLQQLKVLDLHSNHLEGDVGIVLSELKNVQSVDLSLNLFHGGLSMEKKNVSSLANTVLSVNLSHNSLNGGFFSDDSLALFRNLEVLDLGYNQLVGELPEFGILPRLRVLRLGNNRFDGSVPKELLSSLVPLEELDLSGNGFSGSIPKINSTTLTVLNLSSNALSGSLPSSLGRCITVDFSRNMISGDISIMQGWEATLQVLDLSSNSLLGTFSNSTSQLQGLTSLKMKNNSLYGSLPSTLGSNPQLSVIDLSLNEFVGPISSNLFTSLTLTSLNLSGNHLVGSIPFEGSHEGELLLQPTLPPMETLDLSSNSFTGTLSSGIGNMGRLKLLNLAKNSLSGELPKEISKLSSLEILDLSSNNFKGNIPKDLSLNLKAFNVSYNDFSGNIPENLRNFSATSFHPGNALLIFPKDMPSGPPQNNDAAPFRERTKHHDSKARIRIAIIVASIMAAVIIAAILLIVHRARHHEFHGRNEFTDQTTSREAKPGRSTRSSLFNFRTNIEPQPPTSSLSFSNAHLLTSNSRSFSGPTEPTPEIGVDPTSTNPVKPEDSPTTSPLSSDQPVTLNVYSPDRLAGELYFLDGSLSFTAEELSRAPAEVLGRSSHGTLYKATLDSGHMLTVKWLRVGLVKHKKEFAKEVKKIGSVRHPNIVPLRAYYWGPREQERLILADYIHGDSLSLHLYESTPRRYSPLTFIQRLKIAVDIAKSLSHLHEKGLTHGNLKPTNILLSGPDLTACLTDYSLHRLMTPAGTAEQILNLGALGYRAPELATSAKPIPSFKADVYALGVILMELLTRRSAGDIISGQSGAVDLTDWVRLCDQEGRGMDCIDRDIAGGEEPSRAMEELLGVSLRCILAVNERPNIRQIYEEIYSISA